MNLPRLWRVNAPLVRDYLDGHCGSCTPVGEAILATLQDYEEWRYVADAPVDVPLGSTLATGGLVRAGPRRGSLRVAELLAKSAPDLHLVAEAYDGAPVEFARTGSANTVAIDGRPYYCAPTSTPDVVAEILHAVTSPATRLAWLARREAPATVTGRIFAGCFDGESILVGSMKGIEDERSP
jgi:hypothetical protein